jgi:hypothetical protein
MGFLEEQPLGNSFEKVFIGNAGTATSGLDITEVFSTYLYTSNNTDQENPGVTQTISNGIDLSGEGGLVWIKKRNNEARHHILIDTERGAANSLTSSTTGSSRTDSIGLDGNGTGAAFTSSGFTVGDRSEVNSSNGESTAATFVSWSFRKAPKFFDIQTWSGNGTAGRTIAHNIGSAPGMILVKDLGDADNSWNVYHRAASGTPQNSHLELDNSNAVDNSGNRWNNTSPTSAVFSVGNSDKVNASGHTYVAYLFAHNDDDGGFGPDGDKDIIKCGTYNGNGGHVDIDLGWEPQWVLVKKATGAGNWTILDTMRGWVNGGGNVDQQLYPNLSDTETAYELGHPTATGWNERTNTTSGQTYIYIAIRRGPLATPEAATEVFKVDNGDGSSVPSFTSGFPVDFGMLRDVGADSFHASSRLTSVKTLDTNSTAAEGSNSNVRFDYQNGWFASALPSNYYSWMWKRAPSFFDVVAYTGNGTAGRTVSHNLGVVPEMIWVKSRTASNQQWRVYHSALGATKYLDLNQAIAAGTWIRTWNDTEPTSSVFTLGNHGSVNDSGATFIAYLFASLDGISKVGSYTGNGSTSQTIDCGFSNGARFVLIKCTNDAENWIVFDSARGIVSGNDPYLSLNTTDAANTGSDFVDPASSGFIVNSNAGEINNSNNTYIFYAIA